MRQYDNISNYFNIQYLKFNFQNKMGFLQSLLLVTLATFEKCSRHYNVTNRLQDSNRRLKELQLSLESNQIGEHFLFY